MKVPTVGTVVLGTFKDLWFHSDSIQLSMALRSGFNYKLLVSLERLLHDAAPWPHTL